MVRRSSRKLVPWLLALCLGPAALGVRGLPWHAAVFESPHPFPEALKEGVAEQCEGRVTELLSHLGRELSEPRDDTFQRLDLNADGRCDYLLRKADWSDCGTGGCPYYVYVAMDGGFRRLGELFGWGFRPLEPHGGYLQLESGDSSGGEMIRTLNRFNGREYDWVYSDFHRLRLEDDVWVFYKRHENDHWREETDAP